MLLDVSLGEVDDGDTGELVVAAVVAVPNVVDSVLPTIDELIKVVEDPVGSIEPLLRLDAAVCTSLELAPDVLERLIGTELGPETELVTEETDDGTEEVLELLPVEIPADAEPVLDVGPPEEAEGLSLEGPVEYPDNVLVKALDDTELVIETDVDDSGGSDPVTEKEPREGVTLGEDDALADVSELVVNVGVPSVDVEDTPEVVDVIG